MLKSSDFGLLVSYAVYATSIDKFVVKVGVSSNGDTIVLQLVDKQIMR